MYGNLNHVLSDFREVKENETSNRKLPYTERPSASICLLFTGGLSVMPAKRLLSWIERTRKGTGPPLLRVQQ